MLRNNDFIEVILKSSTVKDELLGLLSTAELNELDEIMKQYYAGDIQECYKSRRCRQTQRWCNSLRSAEAG